MTPANWLAKGEALLDQDRIKAATACLRRAVRLNPGDAYARQVLGESYQRMGRLADAERALRAALALGDNPQARLWLGETLELDGRREEADVLYREVERSERASSEPGALRRRATALLYLREARRSLPLFRRAVEASNDWSAHGRLAEALLCAGDAPAALKLMGRTIGRLEGKPRAQARAWRGLLRLWIGDYRGALSDLDARARYAPCWRGAALLKLGRAREAVRELNRSLTRDPWDREALTWRGEARRILGQPRLAIRDFDAALRMGRGNFWAAASRALAQRAAGDRRGFPTEVRRIFRVANSPDAVEARLRSARGVRRVESYLFPVWRAFGR